MLYTLLGRAVWRVFRGYLRHKLPSVRGNLAAAGIVALALAGAGVALKSSRRREGG